MIIDVVTFNGEYDLLEIRLNILDKYVDEFIIVESCQTFSGKGKPLYYWMDLMDKEKGRFHKWRKKIKYHVNEGNYTKEEIDLAYSSPNTQGADHWKTEFLQKENIKKALTHLKDDDIVFIGDCDEIWKPDLSKLIPQKPLKLKLLVYTYYLNNKSSEQFWGTIMSQYKDIKNSCLNHLRSTNHKKTQLEEGWHFTSMAKNLKQKLEDSYTKETYANDWVLSNLVENIKQNKDFLGRNFTYQTDESQWPRYLKNNKEKYKHLLLNEFNPIIEGELKD